MCVCLHGKDEKDKKQKVEERKRDYYCLFLVLGGKKKKIKVKWDQCSVERQMGLQQESSSNVLVTNTEMEIRNRYNEIENQ